MSKNPSFDDILQKYHKIKNEFEELGELLSQYQKPKNKIKTFESYINDIEFLEKKKNMLYFALITDISATSTSVISVSISDFTKLNNNLMN